MATIIDQLGEICGSVPGYVVHAQAADMLVTLPLPGGRKQTVKVWTEHRDGDAAPVLRLLSRAALVQNPAVVRDALRRNAENGRAGFALDLNVSPPALDVVCGLPFDPRAFPVNDFLGALSEVAMVADHVEARLAGGADRF